LRHLSSGGGGRETAVHDMKRTRSGMMEGVHVGTALSPAPVRRHRGHAVARGRGCECGVERVV